MAQMSGGLCHWGRPVLKKLPYRCRCKDSDRRRVSMHCLSSGISSRRWTVARKAAVLLAVSCAVLLFSVPLFSQGNLGRITGSVTDASGGAIVGATVTDTDVARGTNRTVTTDSAGQYAFPGLNPGTHKIHAEAKGFKAAEHAN